MARFRNTSYLEKSFPSPSPRTQMSREAQRTLRRILVSGGVEAFKQAREDFLGTEEYVVGAARWPGNLTGVAFCNYVSRIPPDVLNTTSNQCQYCLDVSDSEGVAEQDWDDDNAMSTFEDVLLTLEYRAPLPVREFREDSEVIQPNPLKPLFGYPDESLLKRQLTKIWRQAGRIFTLPGGFFSYVPDGGEVWAEGPIPINPGVAFREPQIELTYIHHDLPVRAVPIISLMAGWNTVNKAAFDSYRWGNALAPGTVLFIHAEPKDHYLVDGSLGCDLYLRFLVAPNNDKSTPPAPRGWNAGLTYLPGTNPPKFDYRTKRRVARIANVTVVNNGDDGLPISSFDFDRFFRPDQPGGL